MGTIFQTEKRDDGKLNFTICLDYREAINLKGFMENVHLFAESNLNQPSKVSSRGNKDATKYFLIPKNLRDKVDSLSNVKCERIDLKNKSFFVYMIDHEKI